MKFLEIDAIQVPNMIPTANKGIDYKRQVSIRVREDLHKKLAKTYIGVEERYGIKWEKTH